MNKDTVVPVVPPQLSRQFHSSCNTCSKAIDTKVPKLWYECYNSVGTVVSTGLEQVCQKASLYLLNALFYPIILG